MSKNAPPPQRTDTLQRLKDHYAKRIDDSCEQMLESFHGMLRAAHVRIKLYYFGTCIILYYDVAA
jgi:hypothetical protein